MSARGARQPGEGARQTELRPASAVCPSAKARRSEALGKAPGRVSDRSPSPPAPCRNFLPRELALAAAVAIAVQAGAVFALRTAKVDAPAAAAPIEEAAPVAVKVVPVLDLGPSAPLLKLGGKPEPQKLPDRVVEQAAVPRVEEKAFVSTKAGKSEADIPPPEVKVADANTRPPPPNAELAKQVDTPVTTDIKPGPPANVAEEGHQDGVKEGTETDPLKARAVDLYRARIIGWFSRRFRVSGSGLSAEELGKYRVSATVELSSDRRVIGYSIVPSGNAVFDAAARSTLDGSKGDSLPPPPENYPDIVHTRIQLTFVCREDRCD